MDIRYIVAGCLLLLHNISYSFDRSFFYRASSWWPEPRFERPGLSTGDILFQGGSTCSSRNACGKTTSLLAIYGPELVPDEDNNQTKIKFNGVFDAFEANFTGYQNLLGGLFWQFHLPVVLLQLYPCRSSTFCMEDSYCLGHKISNHLRKIIKHNGLSLCPLRQAALSDCSLFCGWTTNYQNTCWLDFIDFTGAVGVLFPTGKRKNPAKIFDIAYGYNGHWGIPLYSDLAFGALEWFTIGFHADCVFLFEALNCIGMKTFPEQTGFIRPAIGCARVKPGSVWRAGTYIKADHFCKGLSLALAFSYETQKRTHASPLSPNEFPINIVNTDPLLKKWSRSIVHFILEYDFGYEEKQVIAPRVSIFYNKQMTGKRVFSTSTVGGTTTVDIAWYF